MRRYIKRFKYTARIEDHDMREQRDKNLLKLARMNKEEEKKTMKRIQ